MHIHTIQASGALGPKGPAQKYSSIVLFVGHTSL